jgi:hypothetical protein
VSGSAANPHVFPRHGWVPSKETGKVYVFLPFLGCMAEERDRLKRAADNRLRTFRTRSLDLEARLILALKSIQAWRTIPGSASGEAWLLEHCLYADLVFYEFSCLYDSVARILAHFAASPADRVDARSFHAFVHWVRRNESSVQKMAPWMVPLLKDPELEMVKSLRNRRTHQASQYVVFSRPPEATAATTMSSTEQNGTRRRSDVNQSFFDLTEALLSLLGDAAKSLAPGRTYSHEDVLSLHFLGLLPSGQWDRGAWLEDWLPKLWDEPWSPWEVGQ